MENKKKENANYYESQEYAEKKAKIDEEKALFDQKRLELAEKKSKAVALETKRLKKILTEERCGESNMHFVNSLIDRAAFLRVEIEYIEKDLQAQGLMDLFIQGTQKIWREHPLSKVHVQHSKSYRETIKQLAGFCKEEESPAKDNDELTEIILRGNKARSKYGE